MNVINMNEDEMRKDIVNDLSVNMFVEAGAGAGKTSLIVGRIVNLLKNGSEPSEIVAITFTNAAAEDLRKRIMEALKEAGLNDKLKNFDSMQISTIHSFCNVLLREKALAAGLPIDMELMQEEDALQLKMTLFEEFMGGLTKEDWDKLEKQKPEGYQRSDIRSWMEQMYMGMADLPEDCVIKLPDEDSDLTKIQQDMDLLRRFVDGDSSTGLISLEQRVTNAINGCIKAEKRQSGIAEQNSLKEIEEAFCGKGKIPVNSKVDSLMGEQADKDSILAFLANKNSKIIPKSSFKSMIDQNMIEDKNRDISEALWDYARQKGCEYLCLLYDKYRGGDSRKDKLGRKLSIAEMMENLSRVFNMGKTTCEYAIKARDYYRRSIPVNKMSNDRMLELTHKLVFCEDKGVLEYFARKYKHYFVDEFQDTDRIQASFIYRLAAEPDDAERLREAALFVVGDPKQSIYRFRGAQPEVYFSIKEKMEAMDEGSAKVYVLANNYRSNELIINWVNDRFREADAITPIVSGAGAQPYQEMAHVKKIATDHEVLAGIYHVDTADAFRILKNPDNDEDWYADSEWTSEDDIKTVVKIIKKLTAKVKTEGDDDEKPLFWITDYTEDHKPYSRGIELSDFMLISQQKNRMADYIEELTKNDIPVVLDGSNDLNTDKYFCVYARLLRFLLNPRDRYIKQGAVEALRVTIKKEQEDEFAALAENMLTCLRESVKGMSPYGIAHFLERQISAVFDKEKGIGCTEALISQRHIRQMIEWLCMNSADAASELTDAVQEYIDKGIEHELALSEEQDYVRFMNLHKTKGLERQIVIIMDRRQKTPVASTYMIDGNEYYPGAKGWLSLKYRPEDACRQEEADSPFNRAAQADASDFHRLEYVAVTRAAQVVIFMGTIPAKSKKGGIFTGVGTDKKDKNLSDKMGFPVYKVLTDGAYDYDLRDTPDIMEILEKCEEPPTYKIDAKVKYDVAADGYINEKAKAREDKGVVIRQSPSGQEKESDTIDNSRKNAGKEKRLEDYSGAIKRPVGDEAGDILHKTMELLVSLKSDKKVLDEEDLKLCSRQAVYSNSEKLSKIINGRNMSRDDIEHFMYACACAYNSYLDEIWEDVSEVYPEVGFSYALDTDDGNKIWMNGTADLIMKMKDRSFVLYDYKSNYDRNVPEAVMEFGLKEIYDPQLAIYRGVIRDMFDVPVEDITVAIISFSQKDERGNILGGENIRIRYTPITLID